MRLFDLALNTVCETFLVFCAVVMLLTGGWYTAVAAFILLGCLYRLYRALRPVEPRPAPYDPPKPGEPGFNLYADNADGSRNYPY